MSSMWSNTHASGLSARAVALLSLFLALPLASGCWFYSFTGASIPTHLRTISIPLLDDASVGGQPDLADQLTERLVSRFVRQTRLTFENDQDAADAVLAGRIDQYANEPAAVGGQERATLNRVTIRVSVRYFDRVEDRELMSRTFTSFAEYNPQEGLDGEFAAATAALDNIASDIFTAATSNW